MSLMIRAQRWLHTNILLPGEKFALLPLDMVVEYTGQDWAKNTVS